MARSRSRITRRRFLTLAASAAAVASTTRASAQPRPAGTFISAKTTEAPSLDPILEQALSRQRLDPLFYNRMVEWGHDGKLEPGLAESWTTSADGKTWTFKVRRGVKFHNGRELVADDVKFTYERILDPKTGSGGRGYLSAIEHIEYRRGRKVQIRKAKVSKIVRNESLQHGFAAPVQQEDLVAGKHVPGFQRSLPGRRGLDLGNKPAHRAEPCTPASCAHLAKLLRQPLRLEVLMCLEDNSASLNQCLRKAGTETHPQTPMVTTSLGPAASFPWPLVLCPYSPSSTSATSARAKSREIRSTAAGLSSRNVGKSVVDWYWPRNT